MTATETNESEVCDKEETMENDIALSKQNNGSSKFEHEEINLKNIFQYLSCNPAIIFKSQQIDDPEITVEEKVQIAENLFSGNKLNFLQKFGSYLTKEHILFLQKLEVFQGQNYEFNYLFKKFLFDLEHQESNIKNRRFTAMKKMLIEQNDYFSETEMMKREPILYEQLVGQYLTDGEKNIRDNYDPNTALFSQILLNNYDRDQRDKLCKQQELIEADNDDESSFETNKNITDAEGINTEETFPKIPPSYRKRWGDFEDDYDDINIRNEISLPGTSSGLTEASKMKRYKKLDINQKYVTSSEKEMLRQEFLSIMRSKFIDGIDKEFDYSNIDNNAELDDLDQINQDCEDKYFEDDDLDDNSLDNVVINQNELEDELDIYMTNLNKSMNKN